MEKDNRLIVSRFWHEVFNEGNLKAAYELVDLDCVIHDPVLPEDIGQVRGLDNMVASIGYLREALPDLYVSVEDEIAEGDRVVTRWTGSGTHLGEIAGVKPTGDKVAVSGVSIFLVHDGKIRESWQQFEKHWDASQAEAFRNRIFSGGWEEHVGRFLCWLIRCQDLGVLQRGYIDPWR